MSRFYQYLSLIIGFRILQTIARSIYHVYFDSLSEYPGPKLWAISSIPAGWAQFRGYLPYRISELHEKYGPVVRIGPKVLSYATSEAFTDIYCKVRPQLIKDPQAGPPAPNGIAGLAFTDDDADHARMRRNLSHGFTEKALIEQEPVLREYVDLLIQKLHEQAKEGPIDMSAWFNFFTTDVIGDLTFGESFQCLEKSTLHSWMLNIFFYLKAFVIVGILTRLLPFMSLVFWFAKKSKSFGEKEALHRGFTNEKLDKRLKANDPKPDFMTYVQKYQGTPTGMSLEELQETCSSLMIGGAETTASLLSAAVYFLLTNPEKCYKLKKEIRSEFQNVDEINIGDMNRLTYTPAVIEETLRIFPPLPQQIQRVTSRGGNSIIGRYVPAGVKVGVTHWATYHSSANFKDPDEFIPERWLGYPEYSTDRRDALKPFSAGPRNCIGQNLAYAEMKLVLCRIIWTFDMELCEECKNWARGIPIFAVYQRPPLMIKLLPVAGHRTA